MFMKFGHLTPIRRTFFEQDDYGYKCKFLVDSKQLANWISIQQELEDMGFLLSSASHIIQMNTALSLSLSNTIMKVNYS